MSHNPLRSDLKAWVDEVTKLCRPKNTHLYLGTPSEYNDLLDQLVKQGTLTPLPLRKNCYLARSHPSDVARLEERTFIASLSKDDAGPLNNWVSPSEIKPKLDGLFNGVMEGRTLYIVPFCMGPLSSPYSRFGVQITDSPYVVLHLHLMTRSGQKALEAMQDKPFAKCLHSVGFPLSKGKSDIAWPCDPLEKYIVHFPEELSVISYGSGYGGNAILSKKCFALRLASTLAKKEGWLAEHMLILGITNPQGIKKHIAAAFPSSCGKTNLAMLDPSLVKGADGWKVECMGDDIAWLFPKDDRFYAINPEAGFFGVAPGTSLSTNPKAMKLIEKNTIFTNCALTPEGDVWWAGLQGGITPIEVIDWKGEMQISPFQSPAAHPNARYTSSLSNYPGIDPDYDSPTGVTIDAILFGGRRVDTWPLIFETNNWTHGVLTGAMLSSETTAASIGQTGQLRRDPFAMLPFCGYHLGDYLNHWLSFKNLKHLPKIYGVNWFLRGEKNELLWPGYCENFHVLKWVFSRITDTSPTGTKTPIGTIPTAQDLPSTVPYSSLFHLDQEKWKKEIEGIRLYLESLQPKTPQPLLQEIDRLEKAF